MPPSRPSCTTVTPTSTSTSPRPPPGGCGARTSCGGGSRSNRNSRTSAPRWPGRWRATTLSCGTVPLRAARGMPSPLRRRVAARRRSGARRCPASRRSRGTRSSLVAAAAAAFFHGRLDRAEQLCQQALDAAGEPNDELGALTFMVRSHVALRARRREPAPSSTRSGRRAPAAASAICPCSFLVSTASPHSDPLPATSPGPPMQDERHSRLARQTGNPGQIEPAPSAGSPSPSSDPEPEQSRTLIAESLELNDALGGIVVDENALIMVLMASALLGERDACPQTVRPRARPRAFAARRQVRLPRGHRRGTRPRRSPTSPPCSTEPSTPSFPASRRPTAPSHSARTRDRSHPRPTRRGACERAARAKAPR